MCLTSIWEIEEKQKKNILAHTLRKWILLGTFCEKEAVYYKGSAETFKNP